MRYLAVSGLPLIEEEEATGELPALYVEMKESLGMTYVPNLGKAMGIAPHVLRACIATYRSFFSQLTLPQPIIAMISYCIPTAKNCKYCAANGELHCRALGIDEEILEKLAKDLGNVNPKRIQAIIHFAVKCALTPQQLEAEDYDRVREQGVTDEELVELIYVASMANLSDTLADALKIEVDGAVVEALRTV